MFRTLIGLWLVAVVGLLGACTEEDGRAQDQQDQQDQTADDVGVNDSGPADDTADPVEQDVYVQECGNGVVDPDEACDDGNLLSRDGCSEMCDLETVVLRNVETRLTSSECSSDDDACVARYDVTLTLQNFTDLEVDRVSHSRLRIRGYEVGAERVFCEGPPFLPPPNGRTEIIELRVSYHEDHSFSFVGGRISVASDCDGGVEQSEFETESSDEYLDPFPTAGSIELEFEGLLEDGAVWTTSATSDIRDRR